PYDLTFRIRESAAGLEGWLEFNADIYEPDTIRRLRQHWMTLLQEIIAHPESRLSALPLLTSKEKEDLIALQSGPRVSYRTDCGVHHLFEEQAERTPAEIAVVFEGQQLTYAELNRRAQELAQVLHRLNVGPNVPVGIALERSLDVPVAVLGVLKAGGAYVPLDPAYPRERLRVMVENARLPILLTHSSLQSRLDLDVPNLQWICLDAPSAPES